MTASELTVDHEACSECALCVAVCPYEALVLRPARLQVIQEECILCDLCVIACPTEALAIE